MYYVIRNVWSIGNVWSWDLILLILIFLVMKGIKCLRSWYKYLSEFEEWLVVYLSYGIKKMLDKINLYLDKERLFLK